jgi:hypothetical protein
MMSSKYFEALGKRLPVGHLRIFALCSNVVGSLVL